jgi:integrase
MSEMKPKTNVRPRGKSGVYYYRARFPTDLKLYYGKEERWISLRTKNVETANERATKLQLELYQEYASVRASQNIQPVYDVPEDELERIALLWLTQELEDEKADRIEGYYMDDAFFAEQADASEFFYASSGEWLARGNFEQIKGLVNHQLKLHGIQLDESSLIYRKACFHFAKATRRLSEMFKLLDKGEIVETPHVERVAPKPRTDDTLHYLLGYWNDQRKPADKTYKAAKLAIEVLSKQTNNKPASKITKSDIVLYKDTRLAAVTPGTVEKDLNLLQGIFSNAVDNDKLTSNPAVGVKAPPVKGQAKARLPFDIPQLQTIFTSSIYTESYRPRGGAGEAAFWLPLISLFSGARLTELGQLDVDDVKEEKGISYFLITTDSTDENTSASKTLKTQSSHRRVPVHPELVRCGFLKYADGMRKAGHRKLFPAIKSDSGQLTGPFSKWFNGTWLRKKLAITDSRKVFHSFRHGFKHWCRVADISTEHHDKLTGHASGNIGDSYGDEFYPLQPLANAISKLFYEGLDLSHLHKNN